MSRFQTGVLVLAAYKPLFIINSDMRGKKISEGRAVFKNDPGFFQFRFRMFGCKCNIKSLQLPIGYACYPTPGNQYITIPIFRVNLS